MTQRPLNWGLLSTARINRALIPPLNASKRTYLLSAASVGLCARPVYRRQGLTRLALLEGLHQMQRRGMDRVCISTGDSNKPAIRLYESIGFKMVNKTPDYVKTDGAIVPQVQLGESRTLR
jgi:RimJ/RimL family protein N-acetyltransferase